MTTRLNSIAAALADAQRRLGYPEPDADLYTGCHASVYVFPQGWGSTALGFGGIGGQMCTTAHTVVVVDDGYDRPQARALVYFGSGFAYEVLDPGEAFYVALHAQRMPSRGEAGKLRRT
jgi:hypothetical protein